MAWLRDGATIASGSKDKKVRGAGRGNEGAGSEGAAGRAQRWAVVGGVVTQRHHNC